MSKQYKYGFILTGDAKGAVGALRDVELAHGKASRATQQHEKAIFALKAGIGAIAASFVATAIKTVSVARETEKMTAQLKTMTGSMDAATKEFARLNEFAKETPFTLKQSVDAFVKLKALGLDPSERAMKSYGNTASAMGKDLTQMIEAVADASTNEFERLKEFGIKARQQGDNVTFTFRGVETTIQKSSENIQEYLLAIGETNFAGAMADQVQTLDGQLSNLGISTNEFFNELDKGTGISEAVKTALSGVSDAIVWVTDALKQFNFQQNNLALYNAQFQVDDYTARLAALRQEYSAGAMGVVEYHTRKKELESMMKPFVDTVNRLGGELGYVKKETKEVTKETKKHSDVVSVATKKIKEMDGAYKEYLKIIEEGYQLTQSVRTEQEQYTDSVANWIDLLTSGAITQETFTRLVENHQKELEKATQKTKEHVTVIKEEVPQAYKNAATGIQNSFTNMFESVFSGGKDSFDNFADSIKNIFTKMLAEMATMAIAKPIILPMMAGLGSTLGLSGTASAGVAGQLGGGNLLGSIPFNSIGSFLSNPGSLFSGIGSLFSTPSIAAAGAGVSTGLSAAGSAVSTVGGAAGGLSGIMGAIGSALPWVGGALAIGSALGLFDSDSDVTPDLNAAAHGRFDPSAIKGGKFNFSDKDFSQTIGSRFGYLSVGTQHDAFSSESEARQFSEQLKAKLTGLDSLVAGAVGEELAKSIEKGMEDFHSYMKDEEFSGTDTIDTILRQRFTKIFSIAGGEFDSVFNALLSDWDLDQTVATLASFASASKDSALSLTQLTNVLKAFNVEADELESAVSSITILAKYVSQDLTQAFDYFVENNRVLTLFESYQKNLSSIGDVANDFDMSVGSLTEISKLVANSRELELNLLMQIKNMSESLSVTTGNLIDKWRLDVMTQDEKDVYYQEKALKDLAALKTSSDPNEINRLANNLYGYGDILFSGMSDEDKKATLGDNIAAANYVNSLAQERLTLTKSNIEVTADVMKNAILEAMTLVAERGKEAADIQLVAAQTQQSAATTLEQTVQDMHEQNARLEELNELSGG